MTARERGPADRTDRTERTDGVVTTSAIVIVEDQQQVRQLVADVLSDLGGKVREMHRFMDPLAPGLAGMLLYDVALTRPPNDAAAPSTASADATAQGRSAAVSQFVTVMRARFASHLSPAARARVVQVDDLTIDFVRRRVRRGSTLIRLTPTEWRLLHTLARNGGRPVGRSELIQAGIRARLSNRALRVYITHLRKKIEREPSAPRLILTEPGFGYRFARGDEVEEGVDTAMPSADQPASARMNRLAPSRPEVSSP